jgi:hypothetical protein
MKNLNNDERIIENFSVNYAFNEKYATMKEKLDEIKRYCKSKQAGPNCPQEINVIYKIIDS